MPSKPSPRALAMIICDTVITDKKTNKKSLIGIFDGIRTKTLPLAHPHLNVFVSLMDGIGEYRGRLVCTNMTTDKTLLAIDCKLNFKERLQTVEFNLEIVSLSLPDFGSYTFDFFCDDDLVISRKFGVRPLQKKK